MTETTIFILDDDPVILRAAAEALEHLGKVHQGSMWSEVAGPLMRAGRESSRLVLVCDLNMPDINGLDFCRIVRRHNKTARIVLFSASPPPTADSCVDAFVNKSQGLEALVLAVADLG